MLGSDWCLEIKQFDLESQGGVWWDDTSSSCLSVSIFRWANQSSFLALFELTDTLIPSSDNLSNSDLKFKWSSLLARGIEYGSIHQSAMVMGSNESALWANWSFSLVKFFNLKSLTHFDILFFELLF